MNRGAYGQATASKKQKKLWILIFLLGLLLCAGQSAYLICKYRKYPVIEKTKVALQIPLQFPSVTICTNIPCSLRCAPKSNKSAGSSMTSDDVSNDPDAILTRLAHLTERERYDLGYKTVVHQYSHNIKKETGIFYSNNLYYGNCMTFNGGTIEAKAAENRVMGAIVPTQVHRKYKDAWRSRSYVVLIHEPHTAPVFINPKNLVTGYPGDIIRFIVTKKDYELKPSPYNSQCVERGQPPPEKSIDFYSLSNDQFLYTMESCLQNCVQNLTQSYCQCVQPKLNFVPLNNTEDLAVCYDCPKIPTAELRNACGCKRPCRYSEYDVKVLRKTGMLINENFEKLRAKMTNGSTAKLQGTVLKQLGLSGFMVMMGSYNVQVVREIAEFELETVLASIGGTFGLYLGISVISLCKMFQAVMHCNTLSKLTGRNAAKIPT